MTRERSTSDSSLKDKTFTGKRPDGTDYPAEWTLDDEKAEAEFVAKGMFSWRELRSWRFWLRKEWIGEFSIYETFQARWSALACREGRHIKSNLFRCLMGVLR